MKGPKGPEPALGFFEKKKPDCPTLVVNKATKQQKLSPNEPGGRANVFSFLRHLFTSTLYFRLRYVTVAGATSFRLRCVTVAGVRRIAARV